MRTRLGTFIFDPNLSTAIVKIIETLFYTNNEKKSMT